MSIVRFLCGGSIHRLLVRGPHLTLLDYDDAHRGQDAAEFITTGKMSTCACFLHNLQKTTLAATSNDLPVALRNVLGPLRDKKYIRSCHRLDSRERGRRTPVDFVLCALRQESAACSIPWEFFSHRVVTPWSTKTGVSSILVGGFTVHTKRFMECRRALVGGHSAVLRCTMGVHLAELRHLVLPHAVDTRTQTLKVLRINTCTMDINESWTTCALYQALRDKKQEYRESLFQRC
jgi:hypothetical protein